MIHAGVRDTINFEIRRKTGTKPYRSLSAGQTESWIDENCSKDTIPYGVVAQDGLTMSGSPNAQTGNSATRLSR